MADETDFIDLYAKLRLDPGCTLAEFKQAYRRHVAAWHPDRRRSGRADALAAARLQRLTAQYGAAMEFHRRHGRLPGASLAPRMHVDPDAASAPPDADADVSTVITEAREPAVPRGSPPRTMATRWWAIAAAVAIAVAAWSLMPGDEATETESADEPAVASVPRTASPIGTIVPGSSESEVLALEGEPTARGDDRWEYGPSWIRFENDRVVDWYSSPLRGLHVATPRPVR